MSGAASGFPPRSRGKERRVRMPDTPIRVAYPAGNDLHLRIALGACQLRATPGVGEDWVTGTYHDPTDRRRLRIVEEEAGAPITPGQPPPPQNPARFRG